jgi:hypothetical protein
MRVYTILTCWLDVMGVVKVVFKMKFPSICGAKNILRYLNEFYIVRSIKKLSLKYSFCEAVFIFFLTEFHKTLFVFVF